MALSPYAYNESCAQEYYPLTKEEAVTAGLSWKDNDPREFLPQRITVPIRIEEVPDTIAKEILACAECKRNYKIIAQELSFYRAHGIPVPDRCSECRDKQRKAMRNPRKLWQRHCAKCQTEFLTTFAPTRPERVYCEACYLEAME